jgi:hypothetical protein
VSKAKGGHFQLACACAFEGAHQVSREGGPVNRWVDAGEKRQGQELWACWDAPEWHSCLSCVWWWHPGRVWRCSGPSDAESLSLMCHSNQPP